MAHYFDSNPSTASNIRKIDFEIYDKHLTFYSDNGVFSKNSIDEGTRAFLKVLIPLQLNGNILDLGCGDGVIGLTLAAFNPDINVTLADINTRAITLCNINIKSMNLSQRVACLQSDIYSNIEGPYDSIVVNPPIRAGKKVTYRIYSEALQHLHDGGSLYIVIRKNQGAISASNYIRELFNNCTLLKKDKGYYIYQAIKMTEKIN